MKKEIICGIYKITSPTKKIYIGQSVNCLNRRYKYEKGCKRQPKLHNSIMKYGWNAHVFEIIYQCNPDELNKLESYYANLFNVYDKNAGLNVRECGGSNGKHSEKTKELMRNSSIKRWMKLEEREKTRNAILGKKHTLYTIKLMSQKKIGDRNSFFRHRHTIESKNKISKANKCKKRTECQKKQTGIYSKIMWAKRKAKGIKSHLSEESKIKIGIKQKLYWENLRKYKPYIYLKRKQKASIVAKLNNSKRKESDCYNSLKQREIRSNNSKKAFVTRRINGTDKRSETLNKKQSEFMKKLWAKKKNLILENK